MKKNRKRRFADNVLLLLAITTFIFVIANYVSFLVLGIEQSTLITAWFGCLGVELTALISKRIAENFHPPKKPPDNDTEDEDNNQ